MPRPHRRRALPTLAATFMVSALVLAACDDAPTSPGALRFGQIGDVELRVSVPLGVQSDGTLEQVLEFDSRGLWRLTETLSYKDSSGDATTVTSTMNPEVLAGTYAQWITQVNDVQGLTLFDGSLDPTLDPVCGEQRTRVTLRIRDGSRDEVMDWTRCSNGSLASLSPGEAGPDLQAGRLMQAALLLRVYTLGEGFLSAYHASVPFATLARRDDSPKAIFNPRVIRTADVWETFWREHVDPSGFPPGVDFTQDMVLVSAVGIRREAGDSVEVRRVLPVDRGTFVEQVLRVPGDFCSPAEDRHTPFHVVLTPAVPEPVFFQDFRVERVPCGL